MSKENFIYFQNGLDSMKYIQSKEPIIQNNDLLSIQVLSTSLNQEQTVPYNAPVSAGGVSSGYFVNMAGNVEMPVIGAVRAAGLTQAQLQKNILEKISPFVKDPSVIIHFLQFKVNVLGEVKSPGTQKFESDRVTIIDAISAAGDLTDNGKREDISVIREDGSTRKIYKVDIRSGSLFQSPAYILQSNDIIYVGASDQKFLALKGQAKASTQNGLQVVVTVLGLITSIALVIRVFK
jgi:polysaccharide export outer membrane protein